MSVFLAKLPFILVAILIFGVLIAVHELGHFLAAKLSGVQVNEFSIGMGPCLWKREKGETRYSLRLLPIGGFCAMEGESEESDSPRALGNQGFWKRLLIFAAGAGMNFLTGLLIIAVLFSNAAGFYVDQVQGVGLYLTAGMVEATGIGVKFQYIWYQTVDYVQIVWFSLQQLLTGGASMDDVGGPVAIVSTITDVGLQSQQQAEANNQNGILAAIRSIAGFAALIAVNLAVMNLLPIPALDGGPILFLLLDTLAAKLFRRRIPMKYENAISSVFLVALMAFMLFVTAHDIFKLIR